MNPAGRFAALASTVTVALMIMVVRLTVSIVLPLSGPSELLGYATVVLLGAGVYGFTFRVLLAGFRRIVLVRRFMLGRHYIEGTWVGLIRPRKHHTIERISQLDGDPVIVGKELNEAGETVSTWSSLTARIIPDSDQLVYAYKCSKAGPDGDYHGVAHFTLMRASAGAEPNGLDGHASDILDGQKDMNTIRKVSDWEVTDAEALKTYATLTSA